VHLVLSNACDSASAVWWMLKKKAECKTIEDSELTSAISLETSQSLVDRQTSNNPRKTNREIQTNSEIYIPSTQSTPQLAFLSTIPTTVKPKTPPTTFSTHSPLLSPSASTIIGEHSSTCLQPSTPEGSLRDKEKDKRKARSESISIMQRAMTTLEAARLVYKKSTKIVKEKE